MSRFRRFDIVDRYFVKNAIFPSFPIIDNLDCSAVDLLDFTTPAEFDTITELIQVNEIETPFFTTTRRITRRVVPGPELLLQKLSDRVSELELGLDKLLKEKKKKAAAAAATERKYTWTAEIKGPEEEDERKYKWTSEIKGGKKSESKWTAEIKGKSGERTYTYKVSSGDGESESEKKKKKKVKGKGEVDKKGVRVVEIEEPVSDHGAIVLRQAFAKRLEKKKGKRSELSFQDAAALIQMSFRAYLIRRSQALRALRELAIAKNKLKEIRALFNNFSYRRKLTRDAEERQRFSEKLIVLLLTVDAIEGSDLMVRAAKKSMVDELEAMLDVVDPQPPGKSVFMRRRTFDMPDAVMNKELAEGVAQVVRMLDEDATGSETFEACL